MNKKNLFLIIFGFLILSSLIVFAEELTEFTNGLTSENLSFAGDENITRNISINKWANVSNFDLNLKSSSSLISYYNLDEKSTTVKDIHGNNDGELSGDINLESDGVLGNAYDFYNDGDGKVDANVSNMNDNIFSVSFWFNSYYEDTDEEYQYLLTLNDDGGNMFRFHIENYDKRWLYINLRDPQQKASLSVSTSDEWNSWNHVTATYNGEKRVLKLYYNGQFIDEVTDVDSDYQYTKPSELILSNVPTGYVQDFMLDEVSLHDKVLSEKEVSYLYNNDSGRNYYSDEFQINNPSISTNTSTPWSLPGAEFRGTNAILDELNDTSTEKNLSFTGKGNQTKYLDIPKNANVDDAYLNLTGNPISTYTYPDGTNPLQEGHKLVQLDHDGTNRSGVFINTTEMEIEKIGMWGAYGNESTGGDLYVTIRDAKNKSVLYSKNVGKITDVIPDMYGYSEFDISDSPYFEKPVIVAWERRYEDMTENEQDYVKHVTKSDYIEEELPEYTREYLKSAWYSTYYEKWEIEYEAIPVNITLKDKHLTNSSLEAGTPDGDYEWNQTGEFNSSNSPQQTDDFSSSINTYLSSCSEDSEGICQVPLLFHSDSPGLLKTNNININYSNISSVRSDLFSNSLNNILNNSEEPTADCNGGTINGENCTIPFNFHSDSSGELEYSNLNITWENTETIPPIFTKIPEDETITYPTDWTGVDFDASDNGEIDRWFINDSKFNINQSGYLDAGELGAGTYNINTSVNDTYGNTNSTNYILNINKGPTNIDIKFSGNGTTVTNNNYTIEAGEELTVQAVLNITKTNQILDSLFDLYEDGNKKGSLNDDTIEYKNSSLPVGTYYYNSTWDGNENYTSATRDPEVTVEDTTPPTINIDRPNSDELFARNDSLPLNYTVDDFSGVDECWYNVKNQTDGSIMIDNTTITNCENTTFSLPDTDEDYNLTLYSNDTESNIGKEFRNFGVRVNAPAVNLDYPENNIFLNYSNNIDFNFTATDDDGIDVCKLYSNFTGDWEVNETFNSVTSGEQVSTIKNLTEEGEYKWNVECNDTFGNDAFALNNYSVGVDTTNPLLDIITPSNNSIYESTGDLVEVDLSYDVTDKNLDYCQYNVTAIKGEREVSMTNLTDCEDDSFILDTPDDASSDHNEYKVNVWSYDKADNYNKSTHTIYTNKKESTSGGGGGGGGTIIQEGNWTFTSDKGSKKISASMIAGEEREFELLLENLGDVEREIELDCQGDLCDYVIINKTEFVLPIEQETKTSVTFELNLPDDIERKDYTTNLIAEDEAGNQGVVTLETEIGAFGIVVNSIRKLIEDSKDIYGFEIPYFLIFLAIIITFVAVFQVLIFENIPLGLFFNIVIGIVISSGVVYFI